MSERTADEAIELLAWDTAHFGFPVGRVRTPERPAQIVEAVNEADQAGVRCLTALIDADHTEMIGAAESAGFRCFDVRTELERPVRADPPRARGIRTAGEECLPELEPIARTRFSASRFYADPHFPEHLVEELYVAWLHRGLDDDRFVLAKADCDGFVLCHVDGASRVGTIELIGVAKSAEGHGYGGQLVDAAEAAFATRDLARARVVTQGANLPAQRLYQRHGFRTSDVSLWLHRWAPPDV
jgi:dTDP-4-amino-4,6-dideoxy-D-galactose acyltransferase